MTDYSPAPLPHILIADIPEALDGLIATLDKAPAFTFDFECSMHPWHHKDLRVRSVSFSGRNTEGTLGSVVVPVQHYEVTWEQGVLRSFFERLAPIMADPTRSKSAHNQIYDDLIFYRMTGVLPYTTLDTMVAAHILDENRLKSLKYLGSLMLRWPEWDIDITKAPHLPKDATHIHSLERLAKEVKGDNREHVRKTLKTIRELADSRREFPLDQLAKYNGMDSAATYLLRERFMAELETSPELLRYFRAVEMPKVRGIERVIANGIHVDVPTLDHHQTQAQGWREEARAAIPVENPGSPKQVGHWLFEEKGLPVVRRSPKTLAPSTDEETIKLLARDFPEARRVLEYRKWSKYLTTYFQTISQSLSNSFDGRFHPDYRSTSVETGRLASFFHTTPRDPFVRSVFASPPEWRLVQFDYAQIEARLAAWAAGGKPPTPTPSARMMMAFLEHRDIYKETAGYILNKPASSVTKDERQILGKVPVLASLYRISPKGLKEYAWREWEISWSMEQAGQIHAQFHSLWPEFHLWHEREEMMLRARGFTRSPIGRIRRLPDATLEDDGRAAYVGIQAAVNSGINMPIQSLASDITQTAMTIIHRLIDERYPGLARIVGNVHDALLFEIHESVFDELMPQLTTIMLTAYKVLAPLGLQLPEGLIEVEASVGPWGKGEVYDVAD